MRHFNVSRVIRSVALVALVAQGLPAAAQTPSNAWQSELDLITAGAAASIVLHHVCAGSQASNSAAEWSGQRLTNEVARLSASAPQEEVRAYAFDAADMKVRAMAQSTQGQSCSQLTRLRHIAIGTGFPTP